jgi:hypothetical protein
MWSITKVTDEDEWFEGYVRLALSIKPPPRPGKRQKLGATSIQLHETEPGVAFIDTRGGTPDDRVLATQYMKAMLAGHGYRVAQYEIEYEGLDDPISKTAKWGDIMAKAKRLIQSGKVQLLRNGAENIVGSVIGDHGTYQTEISREDPNSQAISQWQCECPWDQYAWQRTRQWKKYEGRPCAHVLATFWKSQATPLDEDAHPAMQVQQAPGQQPPTIPGRTFGPNDPMEQGMVAPGFQPAMQGQGIMPGLPGGAPMPGPGQAMGTPPIPGLPPEILPPFPMEGQMGEPQPPQVSIPGAKPQSPLNPMQWPGGTLSSVQDGWDWTHESLHGRLSDVQDFQNSAMVQIIGTDMGIMEGPDVSNPQHGQYMDIRSNTKGIGEVMGMDNLPGLGEVVEVIFPLDKTGPLQPYHIRAWLRPDQLRPRPDIRRPGPMIQRRREVK